jgi:hypothetical protein
MTDRRPGLNPIRLIQLMRRAIAASRLDLSAAVVLTEAATGAYVVTPILAALSGAKHVFALTRPTVYGSVEDITSETLSLAALAGVRDRIEVVSTRAREIVAEADVVTNSGHVRPIDAEMIGWMKPTAVIPLMYEAWELRPGDVDLAACRARGIAVAGTNERHPAVAVFADLGIMAVKQLLDAGVCVRGCDVLLLCDNDFGPFLYHGLEQAGARLMQAVQVGQVEPDKHFDAIVLALQPRAEPVLAAADAAVIAARWPGAVLAQFWGDADRRALASHAIPVWPPSPPSAGHMGILPSEIGPEPIVRLQAGGLKVGQLLRAGCRGPDLEFVQSLLPPMANSLSRSDT